LTIVIGARKLARMSALSPVVTASDELLASRIADRDGRGQPSEPARRACEELYDRFAPALTAFLASRVQRSQLDDVHQVVWQRVWEVLIRQPFDGHFRGWLFTLARNYLIDLSRKSAPQNLPDDLDVAEAEDDSPVTNLLDAERWRVLRACLDSLEPTLAELIRGRLGGRSYEELCGSLGLEQPRAHRLFHTAKQQVERCVETKL